jgi:uncharacterized protein YjbI with pentapeptide repeats
VHAAYKANLILAQLEDADLSGAHLKGATLLGAHLEGAKGLTVEQITNAADWEKGSYDSEFYSELQNAGRDRKQASQS